VLDGLGIQLLQPHRRADRHHQRAQSPIVSSARPTSASPTCTRAHDKRLAFAALLEKTGVTAEQCGYIGDDVIDLPLLTRVGFAVACRAAIPKCSTARTTHHGGPGGRGAVREVCDMVMRAQGTYEQALAPYFGS
jgi:3-deoxy-D-manno-octulosonate 8-phosphate phosphatase (KDO 8-P phosphatase)